MQIARKLLPLLVFTASLGAHASKKKLVAPPDVLARIRTAHRLRVSRDVSGTRRLAGDSSGRFPAHADLIFQVRRTGRVDSYSGSPFPSKGHPTGNLAVEATVTMYLSVFDPATQQLIWNNMADEDPNVMGNVYGRGVKSVLAPIEPTKPAPHPVNKPAPIPAQLKNPTKLFIQLAPSPANSDVSDADAAVSQALLKLGKYTLVDSANEADVVLLLDVEADKPAKGIPPLSYMRVEVLDPSSKTILWNFTTAFVYMPKITSQQQISRTMPYFLKAWIGKDHI